MEPTPDVESSVASPRILIVTGLWPTPDMPWAGTFVRDRVRGLRRPIVVAPATYAVPMPLRYLRLGWRALTTRGKVDGVEAHVLFPAGLVGLAAARVRRVPLVLYAHGADVRDTAFENPVYRSLARLVARRASAVLTNSASTAAYVRALGREAIVIPPGIDLERFRPSPRPTVRRVLYLGGDSERKGYEVARELADTVVGPGLEAVDPANVPALIAAHDVVLIPSIEEPFGVLAVEAIASGRWVVASRVGGLVDIVSDGVNGALVGDGAFAAALAKVPDYDPDTVARTAEPFSLAESWRRMDELWATLI